MTGFEDLVAARWAGLPIIGESSYFSNALCRVAHNNEALDGAVYAIVSATVDHLAGSIYVPGIREATDDFLKTL